MIKATRSREFISQLQITDAEIRAAVQSDMDRRRKFLERNKILKDNLKGIIDQQLALMFTRESYEDMKPYIDASNNLMRRLIRETSIVYKEENERTVKPKSVQKVYEKIIGDEGGLSLNTRMQKFNYFLNGLNDLIIKVEGSNNELDLTVLTPDMVTVFQNPLSPYMLDAILIEDSYRDLSGRVNQRWIFWSPVRHFILDDQFRKQAPPNNPEMLNPYWEQNMENEAFYPFVGAHSTLRDTGFWDEDTGQDLVEATKIIALKHTFLFFMFPMQFKQLAAKGTFDDKEEFKNRQIKSPLHIMKSNHEMHVLDWQSSLQQLDDRIQSHLFQVAGNYGVSAENFKLTATATSGFARMVAKERLFEIRREQIPTYRVLEGELFDGIRMANNLYSLGSDISEEATLSIDYKEPQFFDDPAKELSLKERKVQLGLMNPLQIIMEENPDITTEEQAEEFLARNIEIRNRIQSRFQLKPVSFGQPQQQGA